MSRLVKVFQRHQQDIGDGQELPEEVVDATIKAVQTENTLDFDDIANLCVNTLLLDLCMVRELGK